MTDIQKWNTDAVLSMAAEFEFEATLVSETELILVQPWTNLKFKLNPKTGSGYWLREPNKFIVIDGLKIEEFINANFKPQIDRTDKRTKRGTLTDDSIMPWGKYEGEKLKDIPDEYFIFLDAQPWLVKQRDIFLYVKENLEAFKANVKKNKQ